MRARVTGVDLHERLEDRLQSVGGNADAGVARRESFQIGVGRRPRARMVPASGVNLIALPTRLTRICLSRAGRLAPSRVGAEEVSVTRCCFGRLGLDERRQLGDDLAQRHGLDVDAHSARLDAREVEYVVDQAREVRLAAFHAPENLGLLIGDRAVEPGPNELREAERRLQRRPQLVTHRARNAAFARFAAFRRGAGGSFRLEEPRTLERFTGDPREAVMNDRSTVESTRGRVKRTVSRR